MSFRSGQASVDVWQIFTGHKANAGKCGIVLTLFSVALLSSSCSERISSAAQALPLNPVAVAEPKNLSSAPMEPEVEAKRTSRPAPSEETLLQQRELFRQGYRLYQTRRYGDARVLLARALEAYPILADYSLYALGVISRDEGESAEAQRLFQRLLVEHPDSVWSGQATLELAKIALGEQEWRKAARYAEQTRNEKSSPPLVRNEAMFILAQAREEQGNLDDAYNLYQELRRITPQSTFGKAAKEHVDKLRTADPSHFRLDTDREYLDELRMLHKGGENAAVDDLAKQFDVRFPANPLRLEVLMLLADSYKRQGRINDAIAVWKEVTEEYVGSALAPVAMFDWATLLWNKDRDEEGRVVFERVTQQYPRHEKAAEAWYAIGRIWQERKEDSRASAAYDRLATLFPGSQLAREGRWRQGWMAYRRGEFQQAEQVFRNLAKSAANSSEGESALYWQARALERQGSSEQATQQFRELLRRYPDGYYAVLVEKRLRITPSPLQLGAERSASSPSFPPPLATHYRRSQELIAVGLPSFARQELDVVRAGVPRDTAGSLFLLAEYSRANGYDIALRFAQELARDNGGSWMRYLYPQAYWSAIKEHANAKGMDPYLVLALIRQESLFNPEVVSAAQAYGLMQLLPKTAARVTRVSSVPVSSLVDPEFNIDTGTSYLRQLLDLYNGNATMAVAAYNAGENAVDKWRARYADLEPDEFVESISFRETRNYVKLVMRNYRTYRRLYAGKTES